MPLTTRTAGHLMSVPAVPGPKAIVLAHLSAFSTAVGSAYGHQLGRAGEIHRFNPTQLFVMNYYLCSL